MKVLYARDKKKPPTGRKGEKGRGHRGGEIRR